MFKQRFADGQTILGTFVKTPHPHVVEVLAGCGFDCLCIDAEHAPFDRHDVDLCILAARVASMPVLVRVAASTHEHILAALDSGADGVVAPHIRSPAEAEAFVQAVHFGPGGRGFAGSTRSAGYGQVPMSEHRRASAVRSIAIAQIEDAEAVELAEEIVTIAGLDAVFIGRADLTVSLGCETPDDPVVESAVARIVECCVAAGKPVGMFLPRPSDAARWRDRGVRFFLLSSDHQLMRAGAAVLRTETGLG